ncbi:transporter substrate-binding domain-containing protein [Nonomuraea sp. NPDC050310]|uniref:serine/threonine-protein kinase n=1 Tax=Nonomuraea sp. NPDC050310 TaxID=3154935 RepID=UPI0033C5DCE1
MPQIAPLVASDPAELGSFRLTGRIGEGGQGIVYLGETAQGERAAIKLLHVKFTGDAIARSRFARELKAAQRVGSFCTAGVMEADLEGDTPYIASEYIDGRPLREIVETDGPLRGRQLEMLAIGTATALVAIHQASIVHRDFKPDNVLIAADGPRVVDFGIARIIDSTGTITSRAIGTPAYMAPEQISGDEVGPYTDVFAWGATIAYAATGQAVFEGGSIAVVLNRILNHEVDVSAMPEPLRGAVRDALAKEADRRPTADQILLRLLGRPDAAGASKAVLSQAAVLVSDDTAPFPRQRATVAESTAPQGSTAQGPASPSPGPTTPGATFQEPTAPPQPAHVQSLLDVPVPADPATERSQWPVQAPVTRRRKGPWIGLGLVLALVAAAVVALAMNGGLPLMFGAEAGEQPTQEPTTGGKGGKIPAALADRVAKTGKIVIGVKADLPGLSLEDPKSGTFTGMEVELARRIATELGATPEGITFVPVARAERAKMLARGDVDMVIATFVPDKSELTFAGPYYLAHHDVLVRAEGEISELRDLEGKNLCNPNNSPSVYSVQSRLKGVKLIPGRDYADCMDLLRAGTVHAVPGEDLLLAGFAQREAIQYEVLGLRLTNEPYTVALPKNDARTCRAVQGIIAGLYRDGEMGKLLKQYFNRVRFDPEDRQPTLTPCG